MKRNPIPSSIRCLFLAGVLALSGGTAQAQLVTAFKDNFDTAPMARDLLGASTTGWKRNTAADTWPEESGIVVKQESGKRFATVTSQGDKRFNARIGARNFPKLSPISDTENNFYSMDMRWLSPGSSDKYMRDGLIVFRNGTGKNVLDMGINSKGNFFFRMSGKEFDSSKLSPAVVADPAKWYRLRVKMEPGSGKARVQVVELADGNKEAATVWDEELTDLTFEPAVQSLELQVQRPSPREGDLRSVDFANIIVGSLR